MQLLDPVGGIRPQPDWFILVRDTPARLRYGSGVESDVEKVGESFSTDGMDFARGQTWAAIARIREQIVPGMLEADAQRLANHTLVEMGATKRWHRNWVRFGSNTQKTYGEPSAPDVVLGSDDIFFLDIGPVWDGFEGDAGTTFVVGQDPEHLRCASDCKELWTVVAEHFRRTGCSGKALYDFATGQAADRGWHFCTRGASGHRLSDFPHALYHKGKLADFEGVPQSHRWVLEIQLHHPSRNFGAFYEDLLT